MINLIVTALVQPGAAETYAIIALIVIICIPILMLIGAGIRLIFGINGKMKHIDAIAGFFWFIGWVLLVVILIISARNYSSLHKTIKETHLEISNWPVIYVELDRTQPINLYRDTWGDYRLASLKSFWKEKGNKARGIPSLTISHERPEKFSLHVLREVRGINNRQAQDNAENIKWDFTQVDSLILINPYFLFDKSSGWRNQKVTAEIFVPHGRQIEISPEVSRVMNVNNTSTPSD